MRRRTAGKRRARDGNRVYRSLLATDIRAELLPRHILEVVRCSFGDEESLADRLEDRGTHGLASGCASILKRMIETFSRDPYRLVVGDRSLPRYEWMIAGNENAGPIR